MSDEQIPTEAHPGVDPTNAKLAVLMAGQTRKILQGLARLEKLIEGPSPTLAEIAGNIETLLSGPFAELTKAKDAETMARAIDAVGFFLESLRMEIRCPRGTAPSEPVESETEPVIEFTPVSWEEYGERIDAALAKSAKKEREMTAMLDAVMAAGWLATSVKGSYVLALAELFATMIPDEEPMTEIPEDWVPVVLAINPMTGEFITVAGPRSGPDGRVEPIETMLARQFKSTVGAVVGAVRKAGRPQPKPRDEARKEPKIDGPRVRAESKERNSESNSVAGKHD